jgi:hypothetical protein
MPNVEDLHSLHALNNAVDHPIDVRLAAIKQMSELAVFGSYSTTPGKFFQTQDGPFEASIPASGRVRV